MSKSELEVVDVERKEKYRNSQFNELMADMVKFEEVLANSPLPQRSRSREKKGDIKKSKESIFCVRHLYMQFELLNCLILRSMS
jgi:hypothetical protein